jgi:hypothetical protein
MIEASVLFKSCLQARHNTNDRIAPSEFQIKRHLITLDFVVDVTPLTCRSWVHAPVTSITNITFAKNDNLSPSGERVVLPVHSSGTKNSG